MRTIKVKISPFPYEICVGKNIDTFNLIKKYQKKLNLGDKAVVVTNAKISKLYQRIFNKFKEAKIIKLPDSEKIKSPAYCLKVIKEISRFNYKNRPFLIGWGGGVVGDLAGFSASIYKRGIAHILVPTTLLAQVDAAIGGKTALDIEQGKNLIGSFWQPRLVIANISYLKTLAAAQIKEGLAEVVKYALISNHNLFVYLENKVSQILKKDLKVLEKIVFRCAQIKAEIVEKDEKETLGIRTFLNFGHTIAHGLEAASKYKISHGQAVILGIIAALKLSEKYLKLDKAVTNRTLNLIDKLKLSRYLRKDKNFWQKVEEHIKFDKKFINRRTRFVLLKDIGNPVVKEDIDVPSLRQILSAIGR